MTSDASGSSSELKGKAAHMGQSSLISSLTALKDDIQFRRMMDIKERVSRNAKNLDGYTNAIKNATSIGDLSVSGQKARETICLSGEKAKFSISGYSPRTDTALEKTLEEVLSSSTKLPHVERIPRYTSWVFLQRNTQMGEDQSLIGKRRIYYKQEGFQALIATDSDDDNPEQKENPEQEDNLEQDDNLEQEDSSELEDTSECEDSLEPEDNSEQEQEEEIYKFSKGEEQIIWLAFEEHGARDEVIESVKDIVGGTSLQLQGRYKEMKENFQGRHNNNTPAMFLETRLSDAMDSFDTLFCRRCLVFDCQLHGSSQPLVLPNDKQPIWSESEAGSTPCNDKCYLRQQMKESDDECNWKPLEKDLLSKGLEIFGKNSCHIARNLLSGLKTCLEVHNYMHNNLSLAPCEMDAVENSTSKNKHGRPNKEQDIPARSRPARKKGRKYSIKSTYAKRKNSNGLDRKQYTPCGCQPTCGEDCPCLEIDNCCEKFCGCSKNCKNRFRGCHCAKSLCRTAKCPCYASGRECDPDVCRNCWASCGDGSLGEPPKQEDRQCNNMRILLRQHQRILLSRSDITGWGAFTQNAVNKNDYLGEYTGEMISHEEAERRGKIYDRVDSSFLFNTKDQWCIDACRKGNKLKFANHSSNPNCYCEVWKVAGEHRIAIFAKEPIPALQEIFYDYDYGNVGPSWSKDPKNVENSDASTSKGQAKKNQSS